MKLTPAAAQQGETDQKLLAYLRGSRIFETRTEKYARLADKVDYSCDCYSCQCDGGCDCVCQSNCCDAGPCYG
jgi:hypothetical protein